MEYPFFTLDVFTQTRFGGNPLAVVLYASGISDRQMQTVAREFNLSETVFVLPAHDAANTAKVRIFTPQREMPFAGHPTIGTAVLLALQQGGGASQIDIGLEENVGLIPVTVGLDGAGGGYGQLTAAVVPEPVSGLPETDMIAAAIGLEAGNIGFGSHQPCLMEAGNTFLFIPVETRDGLARAQCRLSDWQALGDAGKMGALLYCRSEQDGIDYHARLFAPAAGIMEDPATGSAAATFPGALLAAQALEDGSHKITVAQGEDMGRPSLLYIEADVSNGAIDQIRVGGHAVTVSMGKITI